MTRFTFGFTGSAPVWSSDGRSIVYSRPNGVHISADGKFIVHVMSVAKTAYDIGLLSVDGDHRESAYLSSPANELGARFAPDGKWMAYESDESGQFQVYVQ